MRFFGSRGHVDLLSVKLPSVAGQFYSRDAAELNRTLDGFLAKAKRHQPAPKAIIAPHAGYQYSGSVAATAYATLASRAAQLRRIILLGPAHHLRFHGMAVASVGLFRTPLGDIPVDRQAWRDALQCPHVQVLDQAFEKEHSLEVQFPFLQKTLTSFSMLPILVGEASEEQVSTVLARLWGGEETAIVISSDLSHFLDYDSAQRLDQQTSKAIEELRVEDIGYDHACGRNAIKGLLTRAKHLGLSVATVDLRNSGDTAGDKSRVVGYGAYSIFEPSIPGLSLSERRQLLGIAANSIRHGLTEHCARPVETDKYPATLTGIQSSFVTLKIAGKLRGCIGSLAATRPLVEDVSANAFKAAFSDPRFPVLGADEFDALSIDVSVLRSTDYDRVWLGARTPGPHPTGH